ncbi:MAG: hypothetical protein ABR555_08880 [Pyrinomonadaceae bacterium]
MKRTSVLLIPVLLLLASATTTLAQDEASTQPPPEEIQKKKEELEKKAFSLLDQVIDEAQSLRLAENRVKVEINAADLLWDKNQGRARSLFSLAADAVAELMRTSEINARQNNQGRRPNQLRQDLILSVARHDAPLAYQLLASTRPPAPTQPSSDPRNIRPQMNSEDNLEQNLLALVATVDPKFAAINAEQMLDKGQFPRALGDIIGRLEHQDAEAAAKIKDKVLQHLEAANLLSNPDASTLALSLLSAGPRVAQPGQTNQAAKDSIPRQILDESAYTELLGSVIDVALKATPPPRNPQRGPINVRTRVQNGTQFTVSGEPGLEQIEQQNARRLLATLQIILPQIDQYQSSRSQSVRQKLTEFGIGANNARAGFVQTMDSLMQGSPSVETIEKAAVGAPPQIQSRMYQQAAYRALEDGNTDRARQIATDHLDAEQREAVLQRIDFRELSKKAESARIDDVRRLVARLRTDAEKVDLLIQMGGDVARTDPKMAIQVLEEARQITNRRAASYEQFEQQLSVAHAFAALDSARSFEILDPGVSQLNELLTAAATLSGFEVNVFRDGELPLQGGSRLNNLVSRYGQELALLAKTDFERSETLAGRFQFAEPRILARLNIVQGLLGVKPVPPDINVFRAFGPNTTVFRQN